MILSWREASVERAVATETKTGAILAQVFSVKRIKKKNFRRILLIHLANFYYCIIIARAYFYRPSACIACRALYCFTNIFCPSVWCWCLNEWTHRHMFSQPGSSISLHFFEPCHRYRIASRTASAGPLNMRDGGIWQILLPFVWKIVRDRPTVTTEH